MKEHQWVREFAVAITVCDPEGIILEMNDRAADSFQDQGGRELIGSNVLNCHPEPARTRLKDLLDKQQTNVYTIGKNGVKKLIYQSPWYQGGRYAGFIEISMVIPEYIPHFNREDS
jgi:hypothetical protein